MTRGLFFTDQYLFRASPCAGGKDAVTAHFLISPQQDISNILTLCEPGMRRGGVSGMRYAEKGELRSALAGTKTNLAEYLGIDENKYLWPMQIIRGHS